MEISQFFVRKTRDNGDAFYTLSDDRPEWLHDAVYEAHAGEFPDDWIYDTLDSIASMIDDGSYDSHDIADSLVDVYTGDRLQWLSGDMSRVAWVDEAREEGLSEGLDLVEQIGCGQYMQIRMMADVLLSAVADNESEDDEADEPEGDQ